MSVENPPTLSRHGSEYECPVCYTHLLPPIFQCFNGHLICNECIEKVSKCPICRDGLPETRMKALAVEKIILSTVIPCQFSDDGCQELLINSQSAEMHQFDCSYATLKYCSLMGLQCEKKVRKAEVLDHFLADHEGIYSPGYKYGDKLEISEDILLNFGENGEEGERNTMALIHTTDQTFVLKCAESQNEKVVTWKVLVLGSEALAREFSASIKIIPTAPLTVNHNSTTVLKWKGSILPIKSKLTCLQAAQPHLLSVPYKYFPNLFSFGGENGKVKWRIRLKIRRALDREPMVHFQVTCDSCNDEAYISGSRYKCITCPNYDLCEKCMKKRIHAHHFFVVVPRPNMRKELHAVLKSRDSIATALGVDPLKNHRSFCDGDCLNYYLLLGYREHIAGVRFMCIECPNYDLCESCMRNQIHSHHLFVIIRNQRMRDRLRDVLSR